jgi:hypothetical protein
MVQVMTSVRNWRCARKGVIELIVLTASALQVRTAGICCWNAVLSTDGLAREASTLRRWSCESKWIGEGLWHGCREGLWEGLAEHEAAKEGEESERLHVVLL